jgi:hypothetical protein
VQWINPHAWIHVDVKRPDGKLETWMIEGGTPNTLFRRGFTKDSLKTGTQIVVEGYRAKDGSMRANGRDITFPDGRKLFMGSSGTGRPAKSTTFATQGVLADAAWTTCASGSSACARTSTTPPLAVDSHDELARRACSPFCGLHAKPDVGPASTTGVTGRGRSPPARSPGRTREQDHPEYHRSDWTRCERP